MKERQNKILKAVIREYQRTGQPVASEVLVKKCRFDLSSATMRLEMLALDRDGFLEQPHISAGRVPTDKAFRLFLEEEEEEYLTEKEQEKMSKKLENLHLQSLRAAAQFLADFSKNLGISGFFEPTADFHEAGLRWLAEEPEFEGEDLKNIMKSFDSLEDDFNKFFSDLDEEVEVFIGQENPIKYLRNYSLVITGFEKEDGRGVLGILGPKRMDYQRNKFILKEARKKVQRV